MKDPIESLVDNLKQVLDNPFPTDAYGRSIYPADYSKGRLAAWLLVADKLESLLDHETHDKVKRLQRALRGSAFLDRTTVLDMRRVSGDPV